MKSQKRFEGIIIPHITPFIEKGELNFEALRKCVRFWIEGQRGRTYAMRKQRRSPILDMGRTPKIIAIVLEEAGGKTAVLAGTGAPGTLGKPLSLQKPPQTQA